jgi:hypothetical protein
MRYKYPLSSQELHDEAQSIYQDLAELIGWVDPSGVTQASGVYDYIDDEIDDLKDETINDHVRARGEENLLNTTTNIRILKG